jgi:hypothetical protein
VSDRLRQTDRLDRWTLHRAGAKYVGFDGAEIVGDKQSRHQQPPLIRHGKIRLRQEHQSVQLLRLQVFVVVQRPVVEPVRHVEAGLDRWRSHTAPPLLASGSE